MNVRLWGLDKDLTRSGFRPRSACGDPWFKGLSQNFDFTRGTVSRWLDLVVVSLDSRAVPALLMCLWATHFTQLASSA